MRANHQIKNGRRWKQGIQQAIEKNPAAKSATASATAIAIRNPSSLIIKASTASKAITKNNKIAT
jgi:hypothetical protein